jgi:type I restriction enzyme, R subunit
VDLDATLQSVNTVQPLVKDPAITLEQLIDELNNPASFAAPGTAQGSTHTHDVLNQLNQKLMRILRRAGHDAPLGRRCSASGWTAWPSNWCWRW